MPGFCFGECDQLLQGIHRRALRHHQHQLGIHQRGDRHEVAHQLVGPIRIERLDGGLGRRDHQQGVAVGRGFRGLRGADDGAGAGAVLHHDRLTERLAQLLAERAGEHVGRPARAERHDHADGAVRIVLRGSRKREGRKHDERQDAATYCHGRGPGKSAKFATGISGGTAPEPAMPVRPFVTGVQFTGESPWNGGAARPTSSTRYSPCCCSSRPGLLGFSGETAAWNAWISGALLAAMSARAVVAFAEWEEWIELALGIWILASPWVLKFAAGSSASKVHVMVGAIVDAARGRRAVEGAFASGERLKRAPDAGDHFVPVAR